LVDALFELSIEPSRKSAKRTPSSN